MDSSLEMGEKDMNHDTLMALAESLADMQASYVDCVQYGTRQEADDCLPKVDEARDALSAALNELIAERDAWKQSNDEQIELMNKIADERDLLKMREVSWESSLMAASAQNEQLRSLLNTYNLGGWTDSLALMKERDEWRTIATTAHRYIEENKALQAMKGQTHD